MSNARNVKWVLWLLISLFLVASVYHVANKIYFYMIKPDNAPNVSGAQQLKQSTEKVNLASIQAAGLFGKKVVKPVPPEKKKVANTRLAVKLHGIIGATRPEEAKAIISGFDHQPRVYSVGDKIRKTDATIDSIEQNNVFLDRSGRLEKLELAIPVLDMTKAQEMPTTRFVGDER